MRIGERLRDSLPSISFEFFPPQDETGYRRLYHTIGALTHLNPSFVSVTYGAGGSTRGLTLELVAAIKHELRLEPMAHLTCVNAGRKELALVLDRLQADGIENLLALRGDPPGVQPRFNPHPDGLTHALELVEFTQQCYDFSIGVACYPETHPEASSPEVDLQYLKAKLDTGADFAISQLFFDNRYFFDFLERAQAADIHQPLIPGLMPVTSLGQVERFTTMCGATLPEPLLEELRACGGDREAVVEVGVGHAVAQCRELLATDVPGLHFFTLNRSRATIRIIETLRDEGLIDKNGGMK